MRLRFERARAGGRAARRRRAACVRPRPRAASAGDGSRGERVRSEREAFRGEQRRGKIVPDGANELERLQVEVAELLLREILGRRVDRGEVAGLGLAVEVVRGDRESVAVRTTADPESRPGDELRLEPRLVEPRCLDLPRLVRDARGEDLQPSSPTARCRADDAFQHRVLVAEEVADPLQRRRLLIAARPLPEHVLDHRQPELGETPSERRADAVQRLDRAFEPIRSWRRARTRPALRSVEAGEADGQRHTSDGPLHNRRPL